MKIPKPLNSTAGYVLLGIVLAFAINQGLAMALSTSMPIVAVESNSMVPTFYRGDILVLQGVSEESLKVGDIIVYSPSTSIQAGMVGLFAGTAGSVPIVHRIVKINQDGSFQTKGDANPGQLPFEKHIEESQIYGKTILIIPYLGWVKIGITGYVMPNILWIAVLAIAAYAAIELPKHIKTTRTRYMR